MKPAICVLCHEHATQSPQNLAGDWIIFADYQALETHAVGHPPGLEYFCNTHLPYAKCFSTLPAKQAIQLLKQNLALYELTPKPPKSNKWRRFISKLYTS